jgi:transposase
MRTEGVLFFRALAKRACAIFRSCYVIRMSDAKSLSQHELLRLLEHTEQQYAERLQSQQLELAAQQEKLRAQDMALQLKDQTIAQLEQERDEYRLAFNRLVERRFRQRSERYLADPDQLRLDLGNTDEAADAAAGLADAVAESEQIIPEHRRRTTRKKRDESLPAHFPRYEVTATVADEVRICPTHGERTLLPESMWDRTETLEIGRPQMKVRVTLYRKYACEDEPACGIASPERLPGLVEGNKYDTSVAAEIITNKYGYHLPLYRQQDFFASCGWVPSRGTQSNLLASSFDLAQPLLQYFTETLRTDSSVGCDDTSVTLLYPKTLPPLDLDDPQQRRMQEVFQEALDQQKPSISAKMWAYRGVTVKLNVFDFTVSRHRDGPCLFFADYAGTLLGDCWHGFEAIAVSSQGDILRAACNAHARRKFEDSTAYPDERKLWLRWYQQLYDIEDRGKHVSLAERLALRQSEATVIWDSMQQFLQDVPQRTTNVILPKSDFAQALQYMRNHFEELRRYLADPVLPMDNNETEQLMKQVGLGRKNWLFAGSVRGGERAAGLLTLVSSAHRNDLDVWIYVKDVLDQLLAGSTDYAALLPWNWAAAHPEAIRQYRVEERRARVVRKTESRAERRRRHRR